MNKENLLLIFKAIKNWVILILIIYIVFIIFGSSGVNKNASASIVLTVLALISIVYTLINKDWDK